jgi:hypothetical protein
VLSRVRLVTSIRAATASHWQSTTTCAVRSPHAPLSSLVRWAPEPWPLPLFPPAPLFSNATSNPLHSPPRCHLQAHNGKAVVELRVSANLSGSAVAPSAPASRHASGATSPPFPAASVAPTLASSAASVSGASSFPMLRMASGSPPSVDNAWAPSVASHKAAGSVQSGYAGRPLPPPALHRQQQQQQQSQQQPHQNQLLSPTGSASHLISRGRASSGASLTSVNSGRSQQSGRSTSAQRQPAPSVSTVMSPGFVLRGVGRATPAAPGPSAAPGAAVGGRGGGAALARPASLSQVAAAAAATPSPHAHSHAQTHAQASGVGAASALARGRVRTGSSGSSPEPAGSDGDEAGAGGSAAISRTPIRGGAASRPTATGACQAISPTTTPSPASGSPVKSGHGVASAVSPSTSPIASAGHGRPPRAAAAAAAALAPLVRGSSSSSITTASGTGGAAQALGNGSTVTSASTQAGTGSVTAQPLTPLASSTPIGRDRVGSVESKDGGDSAVMRPLASSPPTAASSLASCADRGSDAAGSDMQRARSTSDPRGTPTRPDVPRTPSAGVGADRMMSPQVQGPGVGGMGRVGTAGGSGIERRRGADAIRADGGVRRCVRITERLDAREEVQLLLWHHYPLMLSFFTASSHPAVG